MRDVIVVGAGYAGLAAALELDDAGADVIVLEADTRVGGRAWTSTLGTVRIDQGGQWVGPTQTAVLALAQRFGCSTFRSFDHGRHVETWDGRHVGYRTGDTPAGPGAEAYHQALDRLDELALAIDVDDPTACPELAAWDSTTFESWLVRETDDEAARARLRLAIRGVWACEPREVSLFHVLFYVRSAGGFTQLMETHDNAQDSRFAGGAQAPALAMAAALGDRVHLGHAVVAIDWSDEGATVRTTSGTFAARSVVVTGTPAAQARIAFDPALPTARRRWLARSPMGDVAKVHVVYDTPFWRDRGLSGQMVSYGDDSPISYTFDNSPADAGTGVLVAFVYGDAYRSWTSLPDDVRRARILDSLVPILGDDAARPVDYLETRWPEHPIAEGAYAAVPTPGAWTAHGRTGWRAPVGPLVWAGTETASRWNGYLDGAVRSGQSAAATALARLRPDVPVHHS